MSLRGDIMSKEYDRERYNWLKSHGICVACGEAEATKGQTRCPYCRDKAVEKTQKWQKKNPEYAEYQRNYQQQLRQYRRENGLCQQCGKPSEGKAFCKVHAAKRAQKKLDKARQDGRFPRILMGKGEFCYFCGKPVTNYGDKTCPECYQRECEWSARMRERIDYENSWFRKMNYLTFGFRKADATKG